VKYVILRRRVDSADEVPLFTTPSAPSQFNVYGEAMRCLYVGATRPKKELYLG